MTDIHLTRIRRILGKLSRVKRRRLSCFGSDRHRFRLNRPLSDGELCRFETAHAVELPGCYRAFLQHAGNGGAGPYYGLYELDKWNDFAAWVLDDVPGDVLTRPCQLRPGSNAALESKRAAEVLAAYQGTLSIGTQGCTYAIQLIVSGPHRGRVAYVDADGQPPYVVRDHDFLSWYERWLDELSNGYKTSWFGYGPAGGEAEFFALLTDPRSDDEMQGEAAYAFCRLPRLSDTAAATLPEYLSHPLPEVRAGACAATHKFAIRAGVEHAARLLGDPAAGVRREAVSALMVLAPDQWAGAVGETMLKETDSTVASTAFFKLRDAGRLAKADLLRIIESARCDSLRGLAVHALNWATEDRDLAIRSLNEPDPAVRRCAALGLLALKIPTTVPAVIDVLEREKDAYVIGHLLKVLGEFADPAASQALLKWAAASGDDFHRLDALEGLCKTGHDGAAEIAESMLQENRAPVRRGADGFTSSSHVDTIRTLVVRMLRVSPSKNLRKLARGAAWR